MIDLHDQLAQRRTPENSLCAPSLKHASDVTPFRLKISLEDWEVFKFKIIRDNGKVVLKAMKTLTGKQKMSAEE